MTWEADLVTHIVEKTRPWEKSLRRSLDESDQQAWVDYAHDRTLGLDRTLHSICKSNAGRFKSDAQARLVQSKVNEGTLRPHERIIRPSQFLPEFTEGRHVDYLSVQKVFGSDTRFTAYGYILDEAGVAMKIKFKVETRETDDGTEGRVLLESGRVVYNRDGEGNDLGD